MGTRRVVVAGGGLAAVRVTEFLRRRGFDGSVVVLGDEPHLPYDRPPLSKEVLTGKVKPQDATFKDEQAFADLDVELRTGCAVLGLDPGRRVVETAAGPVPYDDLVVCTGARPRPVPWDIPAEGVFALRTVDDAAAIRAELERCPTVVVAGAGFVGAEVASSARALGLDVTVVEVQPTPLVRAVGPRVDAAFVSMHRDNGTDLRCGVGIAEVLGRGRVEAVRLSDGSVLPCDLLVAGLGVVPNVEWLAGSGLRIDDGLVCDEQLCAGPSNIHAAGDVARWTDTSTGRTARGQQWMVAVEQARHVANRLTGGTPGPFTSGRYFWTHQYGHHFQFAGDPCAPDVRMLCGGLEADEFVVGYGDGGRLVGVLAKNRSAAFVRAKTAMDRGVAWADVHAAVLG
ncbi:ferredoxin reductase [Pseudonocardia sulfidoxydans NBRC 16205]|uniref:Ferredoxin reductase n=1 Tax=Pseudonocardia sulfidoxydans NBRC 16205 TaxID=1223511 RepID=A0A511DFV4_9PSEU|nr:FAD-dependent oxidoreductase [Pseudonocardia sulfidoxydans]GEL23662.1 ferredoxin reductase [Pseudonocardia sulfidoxydans NBRC 16205]